METNERLQDATQEDQEHHRQREASPDDKRQDHHTAGEHDAGCLLLSRTEHDVRADQGNEQQPGECEIAHPGSPIQRRPEAVEA